MNGDQAGLYGITTPVKTEISSARSIQSILPESIIIAALVYKIPLVARIVSPIMRALHSLICRSIVLIKIHDLKNKGCNGTAVRVLAMVKSFG
ncbi:MAG: hypothetical protein LBJ67_12995 [Planctomycetaceae bacterium]|jgi:hypothetical protein|nr:hypothetical protein [Planctomycetaceae bacterium]